ncbi:MAG: 5'/3'-nucleotidase SurE [Pseudomonadota bacterium]
MHIRMMTLLAACICLLSSTPTLAQQWRILLTNDDGIDSPLLHELHDALDRLPDTEVVVSAPAENQSGSSHASGTNPLVVERFERENAFFGHAVHGLPADAVRFGLAELAGGQAFDLVISGINRGANVGMVSHLSGTVGAAMEGIYQGIPALAVSQETEGVDTLLTARLTADIVRRYQLQGAPEGVLLSVNVPAGDLQGVVVRPMGESYLGSDYTLTEEQGSRRVYERNRFRVTASDENSDTWSYQQGFVTITPLRFDWTARDYIDDVRDWDFRLPD